MRLDEAIQLASKRAPLDQLVSAIKSAGRLNDLRRLLDPRVDIGDFVAIGQDGRLRAAEPGDYPLGVAVAISAEPGTRGTVDISMGAKTVRLPLGEPIPGGTLMVEVHPPAPYSGGFE